LRQFAPNLNVHHCDQSRRSPRVAGESKVDVENRPQGTIGWVQVTFPLWVALHAAALPHHGL